uniref:Uncharacterized protein n=1 Tax=Brassica oleracea var. oleracea TaxID=109376 RepID=A0A0D3E8Y2_BRAOL
MHGGNDKDSCGTVRMVCQNVEIVGKDELWYGQFSRLIVVPAETPFRTNAGRSGTRLGQSDRYGWMDEPRLNCSERPDLNAELVPCTDPWTGAHHMVPNLARSLSNRSRTWEHLLDSGLPRENQLYSGLKRGSGLRKT